MVQDVASFRHLDAEQLALKVDASRLLQLTIQHLQPRSRYPCFFTVVYHMVVVRVHVEQHQFERDVALLDILVGRSRVGEGCLRISAHDVPDGLRQEHAANVPTPGCVVVRIKLVDGDTS